MASEQQLITIKGAKVLMVGAGGVGCELLKSLALSGFQDIQIVDFDTIEVSNLNRQFLFRQSHVGQSKAKVAREAVLKFRPYIDITSHHANVKDPKFDVYFFKQFDVVLNALDCMSARRHVNRLCLAAGVPLIESGTGGLLGQVFVHVKGKTECFECQPKPAPKTYPVCTITSTPSKFVHCVVWAKDLLFAKLFGDKNQENDLNVRARDAGSSAQVEDIFARKDSEEIEQYVRRIYDHVFGHSIEVALSNEERWKNRIKPKPMYYRDFVSDDHQKEKVDTNGAGSGMSSSSASASLGLKNWQEVWSIEENSKIFLLALKLFFEKREKEIGSLAFDKDDQLAVEFVTSAANIRAACFGIPMMSLFEAKGIAGNIVHAVATTNAIVAGLMVIEAVKVLQNDSDNYRTTYCNEYPIREMLLMPAEPSEPNKLCYVCSKSPLTLEVNTSRTKLRDFVDKIVKATLGMNLPIIMHDSILLYEVGDDLEEDMVASYEANLEKVLCELPSAVTGGTMLTVEDLQQELCCHINIKQREDFHDEKEPDGMVLSGWTQTPPTEKEKVKATAENDHEDTSASTNFAPSDCKQGIIPATDKTEYSAVLTSYLGSHPYGDRKEETVIVGDDDDDLIVLPDGDCWKS